MESLFIIFLWVAIFGVNIGFAVLLYHLGEKRFSNGGVWSAAGLIFGVLAFIVFGIIYFGSASSDHVREVQERGKINKVMKDYRQAHKDEMRRARTPGTDPMLDQMIHHGKLDDAENYIREQLRNAHERGDVHRERSLRSKLDEVHRLKQDSETKVPG